MGYPDVVKRLRGRRGVAFRARLKARQPLCVECEALGRVALAEHIHHIVPLEQGGTNDPSNLQGLCLVHHLAKHGRRRRQQRVDASGWPVDDD